MVPCFTRTNTQWSLWDHLSFRFAVKSLEGHLARSLSPEIRVVSPEIFSQVVRNAESCGSNNTLASLLHIYRPFFVSSKTNKRDILLIYRACFVVHYEPISPVSFYHCLKNEVSYTFIPLVSSHDGLRTRYITHTFY